MQEFMRLKYLSGLKYCHQTLSPPVCPCHTLIVSIDFGRNDPGPERLTSKMGRNDPPTKAETTHPKNWPKRLRPKRPGPKRHPDSFSGVSLDRNFSTFYNNVVTNILLNQNMFSQQEIILVLTSVYQA